jgi:two-component system, cell cycle response regulator
VVDARARDMLESVSAEDKTTIITDVKQPPERARADDCLVVIHAHDPEARLRRFRLKAHPLRIGRLADNQVAFGDDSVSRRHARIEGREDGWYVMDVGSSNGTLVNGREVTGHMRLVNGDRIKIGRNILKYLSGDDVEAAYFEEIYLQTITDPLTQLHNRRYFDEALERECLRAQRHQRPLSLLVVDVDRFKRINDDLGHLTGDYVLHALAERVRSAFPNDTVARYGGEELAVILAETSLAEARALAERLRAGVEKATLTFQRNVIRITVSIGCAQHGAEDARAADLFRRADESLYRAKEAGRNRVE